MYGVCIEGKHALEKNKKDQTTMSKKDFIALANAIKEHNEFTVKTGIGSRFNADHLTTLAQFCMRQNPNFKADRWHDYIAGNCGSNGGSVK